MKILNNDMYLLLIDEEAEIKRGDYLLEKESIINIFPDYLTDLDECKKIIAYYPLTKEAKELDLPELPNPFREVDVEKLALVAYPRDENWRVNSDNAERRLYWIEGYKAAQSKTSFTLEDIKKAIEFAYNAGRGVERNAVPADFKFETYREELIQSLTTQQLPKEFIPEYKEVTCGCDSIPHNVIKTIINSENKKELVGTYKY